jgi:hypothetical protein
MILFMEFVFVPSGGKGDELAGISLAKLRNFNLDFSSLQRSCSARLQTSSGVSTALF